MSTTSDKIEDFLGHAIAGSLVGMIACHRGASVQELVDPANCKSSKLAYAIAHELDEMGIDPNVLASQMMIALVTVFGQPDNARLITTQFSKLLWSILGDPKNGGAPPEIYERAGAALHLTLLGMLKPSIFGSDS